LIQRAPRLETNSSAKDTVAVPVAAAVSKQINQYCDPYNNPFVPGDAAREEEKISYGGYRQENYPQQRPNPGWNGHSARYPPVLKRFREEWLVKKPPENEDNPGNNYKDKCRNTTHHYLLNKILPLTTVWDDKSYRVMV
jgi:hypothetical protein